MKLNNWHKGFICLFVFILIGGLRLFRGSTKTNDPIDISFDVSHRDNSIAFAGDGSLSDGSQGRDIYLLELGKGKVTRLTSTPEPEREPHFSADGASITWVSGAFAARNSRVVIYSVHNSKSSQINIEDAGVISPVLSPHNSYIVFSRAGEYNPVLPGSIWGSWDLYRMKLDGTELTQLTNIGRIPLSRINSVPNSLDVICFTVTQSTPQQGFQGGLYRVPVEKRINGFVTPNKVSIQQIRSAQGFSYPTASPDGKRLACVSYDRRSLYVMDMNGQNAKELTSGLGQISCPRFSSNGKYLYFLTRQNRVRDKREQDDSELWRIDVTGKNEKRIADNTLFSNPLAWKLTVNSRGKS